MIDFFLMVGLNILTYIGVDYLWDKLKIQGRYYGLHSIANLIVVFYTFNNLIKSYTNIPITTNEINDIYNAKALIYGLHIYHMVWYYNKMRYDDWQHHILMVGIALPFTELVRTTHLIGHSMFFINGITGMIDYMLLFMVRNNMIDKYVEKKVNKYLNVWIRCPGCIMNVALCITELICKYNELSCIEIIAGCIMSSLVFWNGIHFMEQVVVDYATLKV